MLGFLLFLISAHASASRVSDCSSCESQGSTAFCPSCSEAGSGRALLQTAMSRNFQTPVESTLQTSQTREFSLKKESSDFSGVMADGSANLCIQAYDGEYLAP